MRILFGSYIRLLFTFAIAQVVVFASSEPRISPQCKEILTAIEADLNVLDTKLLAYSAEHPSAFTAGSHGKTATTDITLLRGVLFPFFLRTQTPENTESLSRISNSLLVNVEGIQPANADFVTLAEELKKKSVLAIGACPGPGVTTPMRFTQTEKKLVTGQRSRRF